MVMQKAKSTFNFAAVVKAAAERPAEPITDFTSLPGGITGGICRFKTGQIGTYKTGPTTGQKFLRLMGIVLKPQVAVRTVKMWKPDPLGKNKKGIVGVVSSQPETVEGRQTSVMYPLCDTTNSKQETISKADNVDAAMNQIKLIIGAESFAEHFSDMDEDAPEAEVWKKVDALLKTMEESELHVEFGTREGDPNEKYPTPRTFETWYRGVEFSDNGQPTDAVVDETAAPEAEEPAAGEEGGDAGAAESQSEVDDLDALAAAADDEDEEAQTTLTSIAEANGVTDADMKKVDTWVKIVAMIRANQNMEEQHGEAEGEVEDEKPSKGKTYLLKLTDPKTNKPFKKASQVEVLSVNENAQTVTVKDLATNKPVVGKDKKPIAFKVSDLLPDDGE